MSLLRFPLIFAHFRVEIRQVGPSSGLHQLVGVTKTHLHKHPFLCVGFDRDIVIALREPSNFAFSILQRKYFQRLAGCKTVYNVEFLGSLAQPLRIGEAVNATERFLELILVDIRKKSRTEAYLPSMPSKRRTSALLI